MMNDSLQGYNNIFDKDTLQDNLTFIALFICLYESFSDTVEKHVKSLLCDETYLDNSGKIRYKLSKNYIEEIKNRAVDDKGNHDILKATMLWFVENEAITQDDYDSFLELKQLRNSFAHEMTDHLWNGLNEEHAKALGTLMNLFRKTDKWWINEIEIPLSGDEVPDGYDRDSVTSGILITYDMVFNTLYNGKSEDYLQIIQDVYGQ